MDTLYWIWLQNALGIGAVTDRILDGFEDVRSIYECRNYCVNLGSAQKKRLMDKSLEKAEKIFRICEERNYGILTPDSPDYPNALRNIRTFPLVLYVNGAFDFNSVPMISLVGTRKASKYSANVTTRLAYSLAKGGFAVISGGALGVDSSAHKGAILAGGKTIAVLGCGLGAKYLSENASLRETISKNGALLSEFPPDYPASASTFPIRNRIIAALGLGTVVVEAAVKSGSLITAKYAREFNRDVFAVPGAIYNSAFEGVNSLLRDGAKAVFGVSDIIEEYNHLYPDKINLKNALAYDINEQVKNYEELPATHIDSVDKEVEFDLSPKKQFPNMSAKARLVYDALENGQLHVNEIAVKTSLTLSQVLSHLTSLELVDAVEALPGRIYKQK